MLNPFLHRARGFPRKLLVDIHSYCNARCTMCPYPRYSRRQSQGRMEWSLYRSIVDELASIGQEHNFSPQMTYCYMGEPFLADDLARYVGCALHKGIDVYLNTNGSAMTPVKIDALLDCGFSGSIYISVHGMGKEVYERIMGLDYEKTMGHIRYLLKHYDSQRVCIRGVDDNWPPGEKQRWLSFWQPYGVQLEYVAPISRCGAVGRLSRGGVSGKDGKGRSADHKNGAVRLYGCRCHHPLLEMVILFDGRAVMCCQDMGRELIWGDVGQDGILGVWNGSARGEAVRQLYGGGVSTNKFLCVRCEQALGPGQMVHSLVQAAWQKISRRPLGGHSLRPTK